VAFLKRANASVITPSLEPSKWEAEVVAGCLIGGAEVFADRQFVAEYDPGKHILSHCTIVSSLVVEDGKGRDHLIRPETSSLVNDNGDGWRNEVLGPPLNSFKSFVGAYNFQEHVQIESDPFIKGRIVDAALRKIPVASQRDPKESLFVYYTDILVRTDRKHDKLVANIEDGSMSTLSMGCNVELTVCSFCGHVARDETEACEHIRFSKRNTFYDKDGYKRIIAELCGHPDEENSCIFIEASWVRTPAFGGAVLRNILVPDGAFGTDSAVMARKFAERMVASGNAMAIPKVASVGGEGAMPDLLAGGTPKDLNKKYWYISSPEELVSAVRSVLGTADELRRVLAQDPEEEKTEEAPAEGEAPAAEEAPAEEAPAGDVPAEEVLGLDPEFMGDLPEGAAVLTEPGMEVEVPEEKPSGFTLIKDEIKNTLRDLVKRELLEELAEEKKEEVKEEIPELPSWDRFNDSLVQSSLNTDSFEKFRKIFSSEGIPDDQLRVIHSGLRVLMRDGWKGLAPKFTSRQILAVARFVDRCLDDLAPYPLAPEGYKAVMAVGGKRPGMSLEAFLRETSRFMGRKIMDGREARSLVVKAHLYSLGAHGS